MGTLRDNAVCVYHKYHVSEVINIVTLARSMSTFGVVKFVLEVDQKCIGGETHFRESILDLEVWDNRCLPPLCLVALLPC